MKFPALDCRKECMKGSNNKDSCVMYCFNCGAFNCSIDPKTANIPMNLEKSVLHIPFWSRNTWLHTVKVKLQI
jgi:hypothetical protein